jgi:WD40 repeat protein
MKIPGCLALGAFIAQVALGQVLPGDVRQQDLTISSSGSRPAVIAYNPNGRFLAAGGVDGAIHIYDLDPAGPPNAGLKLKANTLPVLAVNFNTTNTLVSVSQDQTAKIWNIISGRLLHSSRLNFGKQLVPAIAPGLQPFLAGGTLKQVRLWNYQTGQLLHNLEANDSNVAALAFTPDGKQLVIGTVKGVVRVVDVGAWKVTRTIDLDTPVRSLAASTNHIAIGYADGTVALLYFGDQTTVPEVKKQSSAIHAIAFTPNGDRFAAASADGTVTVWDTWKLKLLGTLAGHSAEIFSVAFSPNGQKIAAIGADGNVNFWTAPSP